MDGPYPFGTHDEWSRLPPSPWEVSRVVRGQKYRVVRAFYDADGARHEVGTELLYITSMFSKFNDELTLCVRLASNEEWRIPLVWKPECQQDIIEDFMHCVVPIGNEADA